MSIQETISQKLATIAANSPRVYAAGKSEGMQAEYDAFWDAFQEYGKEDVDYNYKFYYWRDGSCYNPKYPIRTNKSTCDSTFYGSSGITDTKVDIDVSINTTRISLMFGWCSNLKTVKKLKVSEKITNYTNAFLQCASLENIDIEGSVCANIGFPHSTKLTSASITNIINALSPDTTGFSVNLSLVAVKKAFETSPGANDGNTSAEWTALAATKSNWTISLL